MNRKNWLVNIVLAFVKVTGALPALLFYKPKVTVQAGGKRRLPAPSMLVSNHCSLLDFSLYLMVFPFRTVRFLMAEVLFNKGKAMANFLYALGGIFVDRDGKDFGFVSHALEVLDNGGIVGSFPQGRLPVKDTVFPFTVSTAFIATRTDAPIIPIYTDGNYGLFKRTHVVIGRPLYLGDLRDDSLSEEEQLAHLTAKLQETVYALKNEIG